MGWLMGKLVTWLLQTLVELFGFFFDIMDSQLGFDNEAFINALSAYSTSGDEMDIYTLLLDDVFKPLGVALITASLGYHLYISMFSKNDNEVDKPFELLVRAGIGFALIFLIQDILEYVTNFGDDLLTAISDKLFSTVSTTGLGTGSGNASESFSIVDLSKSDDITTTWSELANGITLAISGVAVSIIMIAIFLVMAIRMFKLFYAYAVRYVQYHALVWFSPIAMSAFASVRTKDITKQYLRAILSGAFSLFLTTIYVKIFLIALGNAMVFETTDNPYISYAVKVFIACAIYEGGKEIDEFLSKIGLTNTVNRLDNGIGVGAGLSMMASGVKKLTGKSVEGQNGYIGRAVQGAKLTGKAMKAGKEAIKTGISKLKSGKPEGRGEKFAGKSLKNDGKGTETQMGKMEKANMLKDANANAKNGVGVNAHPSKNKSQMAENMRNLANAAQVGGQKKGSPLNGVTGLSPIGTTLNDDGQEVMAFVGEDANGYPELFEATKVGADYQAQEGEYVQSMTTSNVDGTESTTNYCFKKAGKEVRNARYSDGYGGTYSAKDMKFNESGYAYPPNSKYNSKDMK